MVFEIQFDNGFKQLRRFIPDYWTRYKFLKELRAQVLEDNKGKESTYSKEIKNLIDKLYGKIPVLPFSGPMWDAVCTGELVLHPNLGEYKFKIISKMMDKSYINL